MESLLALAANPAAWAALITLIVMEVVLGIDNLVFISILSNKLPEHQRAKARRIGISLALIMRLALLSTLAFIVGLTQPVFELPWQGPLNEHGQPAFELSFSWRDLILIVGGLFLVWKATTEIHHNVDVQPTETLLDKKKVVAANFGAAIVQILMLDIVFSIDSILTAVGMTEHLPVMVIAVVVAVGVMLVAANPLANFIHKNPTIVMLALGFLLMIGMTLIADGFGAHVPKGYIYAAMAFSGLVEGLNMAARNAAQKREALVKPTGSAPPTSASLH
jgi:predicted tellurium resistance membrane protein TerC